MNWEALGAIGEIVGAVAVVVTLGYLAVQIRGDANPSGWLRAGDSQAGSPWLRMGKSIPIHSDRR